MRTFVGVVAFLQAIDLVCCLKHLVAGAPIVFEPVHLSVSVALDVALLVGATAVLAKGARE